MSERGTTREVPVEVLEQAMEALDPFGKRALKLRTYVGHQPDRLVQMGITADDCLNAFAALSALRAALQGEGGK